MSLFTNPAGRDLDAARRYVEAVYEVVGGRDPLALLAEGPALLGEAVRGLSEEELRRPEGVGKWSVIEVVRHLADAEMVYGFRIRLVLGADRPPIAGFDQDRWAEVFGYRSAPLAPALEQQRVLREANLALFRSLTPEQLRREGEHQERGAESVERMLVLLAGHDRIHLRQIGRILGR